MVRPGHEPRLVGHRAADGDVGARPGRLRHRRGHPGAHRPAAARGRPRRPRAALRLHGQRPRDPGRPDPGRAGRPGRRAVGLGAAGRRRPGDRDRPWTSACWSPSDGTATTPRSRSPAPPRGSGRASRRRSPARLGPGARRPGAPQREEADMPDTPRRPVRIGNSSGFYGDRMEAAREMVEGGPIDVLTGDYLAELTMLILWKARQKDPDAGYARSVLAQLEQVLGTCLDRGIKIVNNAGGLNPSGLAGQLAALADRLGLRPEDRLRHRRRPAPAPGGPAGRWARPGQPRHRPAAGRRRRRAGDGQRLPRRLGDRRGAGRRRRHRHLPAGHRRLPGHRSRRLVARLAPGRLRPAGRRGRRRARHRVRPAGDRGQLLLPARDHRPPLPGLPDRRDRRATAAA